MTENQALAVILGSIGIISVAAIIYYILMIVAQWKIFTKAGEKGWKSIIPFLNGHVLYKIAWKPVMFWIMLALTVATGICGAIQDSVAAMIISFILSVAILVISIIQYSKLSKAFGHGIGFTLGLLFLNPIFMLILGLGSSQYVGKQD